MADKKKRVMVIDDELFFREFIREHLAGEFDLCLFESGKKALEEVKRLNPDIILLDRVLEDCSGDEICRELKSDDSTVSIPVIMVTTIEEKDEVVKGLEAGADDYLTKPIYIPELLAKIKSFLRVKSIYSSFEKEDLFNVLEIYETLTSFHDSHEILTDIVRKVAYVVNAVRCSVVKIDPDAGTTLVIASSEDETIKDLEISLERYPELRKSLDLKREVVIEDIRSDPLTEKIRDDLAILPFTSAAVIPIAIADRFIGTLFLRTVAEKRLSEKDLKFCKVVARAAASVLENARLLESLRLANLELEKLAVTDGLTGMYNHRYFYNRLDEEFNIANRYNVPLSCIMIDIDFFKVINDTYGHRKGDEILKELAAVIKKTIRKTDIAARYGGEEFVIILPHTDEQGAYFQGERVREAVREYNFSGLSGGEHLTISCGIATYPSAGILKLEDIVKFADHALYEAKRRGRNMSVLYQGEPFQSGKGG